jgi:pilus assembly protein CpaF
MNKEDIISRIRQILMNDYSLSDMSNEELADVIDRLLEQVTQGQYLTVEERVGISDQVFGSIRGFDILDSILKDDSVTEIMVNGPEEIFIEQAGRVTRLEQQFESEQRLEDTIQKIVGLAGREVNQANPIVDTRLPDGSRVNVVLRPISLKGPILTIRKFSKNPMTIDNLLHYKSITPEVAEFLDIFVKAKYNILVSGGTGSGKTTFLNALSSFIPRDERVITIEDSAELQIENVDNLVSLETRNSNASGAGAVTIQDLIKSSLRMRPDRIIVGECRGAEALDMLQAMNTGHDGSLSTAHANSTKDMLSRLETMVLQGADTLPLDAVRRQIGSAIDIIIQLSRMRDKSRRTLEITEVVGYQNGEIILNPLFVFEESEKSTLEKVDGTLVRTKNKLVNDHKLVMAGKKWN